MPEPDVTSRSELTATIQAAWSDLEEFLSTLAGDQLVIEDDQGWTVVDHIIHMAAWEQSVAVLFQGKSRHEGLGIEEAFYLEAPIDAVNERVQRQGGGVPAREAIERHKDVHQALMAHLADLDEADLTREVWEFFPQAPRTDERRVVDLIVENTADHYLEHLEWMRTLADKAA